MIPTLKKLFVILFLCGLTAVSFAECKKALETAGGDIEKAKEVLRKMGRSLAEKRVEKELAKIAADAEKIGDDNPRAAAQLMRKFSESTGMKMGDGFYEALRRIEKGEDPEKVEADMGDTLMQEEPFTDKQTGKKVAKNKPKVDEKLYDL